MLKFVRNEGTGRVYEAEINQGALGVVAGMRVKLEPDYEYVALGALYYDGVELVRPTRPWRYNVAFDGESGNIPGRHGDDASKYSFGPATSEETVLYWHKFIEEDGKTLLVCDRNIVCNIAGKDLNNAGFILGKEIELDGQLYKCRVLTGGYPNRSRGTGESYEGGQLPNEWDRYVMNGVDVGQPHFEHAPAPVPEDYPGSSIETDRAAWARAHNQAWNWISMWSLCQEMIGSGASYNTYNVIRGGVSVRYWSTYMMSSTYTGVGWRPVLELL